MKEDFYNPQNIEAYLRGKLSHADKEFFENGIQSDPLLQNEINLQKDIITSLREHRKADLKSRLNAIEVKAPWYYSTPMKVAASFTTIIIVTLLTYFGFDSNRKPDAVEVENKEVISSRNVEVINSKPVLTETVPPILENSAKESGIAVAEKSNKRESKKSTKEVESAKPMIPSVSEKYNEEEFNPERTLKIPEGNIVHGTDHKTSDLQVQIASTTEHSFHYQFFNNKLFLYCDFSSGPYELLELHNKKSRDLYLFYNDSYYEIKHNQQDITPLRQIKNSNLIKQLSIIKDK